jgi:MYXO-CTERM domain-containing protein
VLVKAEQGVLYWSKGENSDIWEEFNLIVERITIILAISIPNSWGLHQTDRGLREPRTYTRKREKNMKNQRGRHASIGIVAIIATSAAQADLITYDILWEADTVGSAVGSVTIDTLLAPSGGFHIVSFGTAFTDYSITISGTSGSDGTYTSDAGDITSMIWAQAGPIDFNSELISQGTFADFNFFGGPVTGFGQKTIRVNSGNLEIFQLVSVTPVPAPGALALLGLGGLVGTRRRR